MIYNQLTVLYAIMSFSLLTFSGCQKQETDGAYWSIQGFVNGEFKSYVEKEPVRINLFYQNWCINASSSYWHLAAGGVPYTGYLFFDIVLSGRHFSETNNEIINKQCYVLKESTEGSNKKVATYFPNGTKDWLPYYFICGNYTFIREDKTFSPISYSILFDCFMCSNNVLLEDGSVMSSRDTIHITEGRIDVYKRVLFHGNAFIKDP